MAFACVILNQLADHQRLIKVKIKENEITTDKIEESIQKEKEEEEIRIQQALERQKKKKTALENAQDLYMYSEERNLIFQQAEKKQRDQNIDPFFRINKDEVKKLLTSDKKEAIQEYYSWSKPDPNIEKNKKKEFNRNAYYIPEDQKEPAENPRLPIVKSQRASSTNVMRSEKNVLGGGTKLQPLPSQIAEVQEPIETHGKGEEDYLEKDVKSPTKASPVKATKKSEIDLIKDIYNIFRFSNNTEDQTKNEGEFQGFKLERGKDKHLKRYPLMGELENNPNKKKKHDLKREDPLDNSLPLTIYHKRKKQLESIIKTRDEFVSKMDDV